MTPDAFSRALRGERGFAAIELARLAEVLGVEVHYLITGTPDPYGLRVTARHEFDPDSRRHHVPGAENDRHILDDIALAYRQATTEHPPASRVPISLEETRRVLGEGFVRPFADRLEEIGIDVVRLRPVSTAYSFTIVGRAVIVLPATGNWFRENWALAHELGHLVLHRDDRAPAVTTGEIEANGFAADLLLPESELRGLDWSAITPEELAQRVWTRGVSVDALGRRLRGLGIRSPLVEDWIGRPTQRLLRKHLASARGADMITRRMDAASARRFPAHLQDAHLRLISEGKLRKDTLAWMLDVDPNELELDEPARPNPLSASDLSAALGI